MVSKPPATPVPVTWHKFENVTPPEHVWVLSMDHGGREQWVKLDSGLLFNASGMYGYYTPLFWRIP